MKKYGVDVVNFIPGSQVLNTNIAAHQDTYATEMMAAFTNEQIEFYGDYFERYNDYLKQISGDRPVRTISDIDLLEEFHNAIVDFTPRSIYKCEPIRYVQRVYFQKIGIVTNTF